MNTIKRFRVIPCLLLKGPGLYKTVKFKDPKYVGDPINAVRIFNEKEVDELIFLDIEASKNKTPINLNMLRNIASECFMPLCYGGGIRSLQDIEALLKLGVEKVALNSVTYENPNLVRDACQRFGGSTIVASIDYRKNLFGSYLCYSHSNSKNQNMKLVDRAKQMVDWGVGEILLNNIDHDGLMTGFDLSSIRSITSVVDVPVIACGGAGSLADLRAAVHDAGASAVAAGSFFVFVGKHRAVLITYPSQTNLREQVYR
ncbi:MAG: imidazole glycerol phosphate synthase subunit HisF [Planctomycetaceae bacterium]|nr:imidazole glycerol phosphate synthase subunit HisF [Planctomycetaceae bacterium]